MADPLVIIGCGRNKAAHACRAVEMYQGQYFRACLGAARALSDEVLILSAKHGLLRPSERIEPYDMRLRDPEAVWEGDIRRQARALGLLEREVTVLAGADYAGLALAVWPGAATPLAHLGIGRQYQVLSRLAAGGAVPGAQLARPTRDRPLPHRSG